MFVFAIACLCIRVFVLRMMMKSENEDVPIRQGSPDVAVGSALTFRQDESLLLPALISTMMNIDNHIVTLDQYSFYSLRTLVQSTPPRPLSSKREYFANSPPRLITPAINLISQN